MKSMSKKEEKPFQFPRELLQKLGECSAGGFLLFTINEFGGVEPFISLDNEVAARSLVSYVSDFVKSFQEINAQNMLDSMTMNESDFEDEDDGGEE